MDLIFSMSKDFFARRGKRKKGMGERGKLKKKKEEPVSPGSVSFSSTEGGGRERKGGGTYIYKKKGRRAAVRLRPAKASVLRRKREERGGLGGEHRSL